MKKTDLAIFKKLLLEKRDALLKEMGIVKENHGSSTIKESTGDISSYSYHMADQGTDNMNREMAFMMASKSGRLVYHIDDALKRIEDGSYGKCLKCGKPINPERLKVVPHARMCIECKSAEEDKKSGR